MTMPLDPLTYTVKLRLKLIPDKRILLGKSNVLMQNKPWDYYNNIAFYTD